MYCASYRIVTGRECANIRDRRKLTIIDLRRTCIKLRTNRAIYGCCVPIELAADDPSARFLSQNRNPRSERQPPTRSLFLTQHDHIISVFPISNHHSIHPFHSLEQTQQTLQRWFLNPNQVSTLPSASRQ